MSVTVLDALLGAHYNFESLGRVHRLTIASDPIYLVALDQLKKGIEALENGKGIHDKIQEHLSGEVDTDKEKEREKS